MSYFEIISSYHLSSIEWIAAYIAIFILGVGKAGLKGLGVIIVVTLAFVFGSNINNIKISII